MTIEIIAFIAGIVFIFIAIIGGGLTGKGLNIPPLPKWSRVVLIFLGIILLVVPLINRFSFGGMPVGSVVAFAGIHTEAPDNWMLCDGSPLSKAAYPKLWDVIKTRHGEGWDQDTGKKVKDFNLPDYRGRFLRGVALTENDRDPDCLARSESLPGGATGNNVGTLQKDATRLPDNKFITDDPGTHTHSYNLPLDNKAQWKLQRGGYKGAVGQTTGPDGAHTHKIVLGGDKETRPKNVYVNFIIRVK